MQLWSCSSCHQLLVLFSSSSDRKREGPAIQTRRRFFFSSLPFPRCAPSVSFPPSSLPLQPFSLNRLLSLHSCVRRLVRSFDKAAIPIFPQFIPCSPFSLPFSLSFPSLNFLLLAPEFLFLIFPIFIPSYFFLFVISYSSPPTLPLSSLSPSLQKWAKHNTNLVPFGFSFFFPLLFYVH